MKHLTLGQRYEIATLRSQNFIQIKIAEIIGRDRSVVCRELSRNSDQRNGQYRVDLAERKTKEQHQTKAKKVYFIASVREFVVKYLKKDFSPEQIVGFAKKMA